GVLHADRAAAPGEPREALAGGGEARIVGARGQLHLEPRARPRAQRVGDQDLDLVGRELAGALEPAVAARGHDPGARDDGRDAGAAGRPAPRGRHRPAPTTRRMRECFLRETKPLPPPCRYPRHWTDGTNDVFTPRFSGTCARSVPTTSRVITTEAARTSAPA